MTRREALDVSQPRAYGIRSATGSDGTAWYYAFRSDDSDSRAEWTRRLYRARWGVRTGDAPLDPPDGEHGPVDWVPNLLLDEKLPLEELGTHPDGRA